MEGVEVPDDHGAAIPARTTSGLAWLFYHAHPNRILTDTLPLTSRNLLIRMRIKAKDKQIASEKLN